MRYFAAIAWAGRLIPRGLDDASQWDASRLHYIDEESARRTLALMPLDRLVLAVAAIDEAIRQSRVEIGSRTLWIAEGLEDEVRSRRKSYR